MFKIMENQIGKSRGINLIIFPILCLHLSRRNVQLKHPVNDLKILRPIRYEHRQDVKVSHGAYEWGVLTCDGLKLGHGATSKQA